MAAITEESKSVTEDFEITQGRAGGDEGMVSFRPKQSELRSSRVALRARWLFQLRWDEKSFIRGVRSSLLTELLPYITLVAL
jgi:hypothetical protein